MSTKKLSKVSLYAPEDLIKRMKFRALDEGTSLGAITIPLWEDYLKPRSGGGERERAFKLSGPSGHKKSL